MPERIHESDRHTTRRRRSPRRSVLCFVLLANLVCASCFSGEKGETFYGRAPERLKPELRWSDGELPRVFDPALAAAAPDTDAVRALFEGLTELDPRTLAATPAVAETWQAREGGSVWTFRLRTDARWSNGDRVTASDFVRSWRRAINLGARVPHRALFANIQGALDNPLTPSEEIENAYAASNDEAAKAAATNALASDAATAIDAAEAGRSASTPSQRTRPDIPQASAGELKDDGTTTTETAPANRSASVTSARSSQTPSNSTQTVFGVEAVAPNVLRVRLIEPDSTLR